MNRYRLAAGRANLQIYNQIAAARNSMCHISKYKLYYLGTFNLCFAYVV